MRLDDVLVTFVSRKAGRVARWIALFAPLWAIFGTVGLSYLEAPRGFLGANAILGWWIFVLASIVALAAQPRSSIGRAHRGEPGAVSVATGGILARSGAREIEDRAVSGVREELGALQQVVFELRSGDALVVRVRSAAEGDALLEAAGVGPRQRAVRLLVGRLQHPAARAVTALVTVGSLIVGLPVTLAFVVTLLSSLGSHAHAHDLTFLEVFGGLTVASWVCGVFSLRALGASTVLIGRDGVSVQRGLFSKSFVPFAGLELRQVGARIGLRSGKRTARIAAASEVEADLLVARLEAAREAFERREQVSAELVGRNGRSSEEWLTDVRALVLGPADYRSPMDAAELSAIAEDPAARADQRIGAALALASLSDDAPERARLRVAIETTVNPRLRLALERACQGQVDDAVDDLVESARAR